MGSIFKAMSAVVIISACVLEGSPAAGALLACEAAVGVH